MTMRKFLAAALIATVGVMGAAGPRVASAEGHRAITVMTQNLYQGTELEHVLGATTQTQLVLGVAKDYGNVITTNFPERATAFANEIARDKPTLIGLQEVALWRTQLPFNPRAQPNTVAYDFLQILRDALAAQGLNYTVANARDNFDVSAPGLFSFGVMGVRLTEMSAILVRNDTREPAILISNPQQGAFQNVSTLPTFTGPFPLGAGWLAVDVKQRGKTFRFISTHLDGFSATIAGKQADELIQAAISNTNLPVVLVGDFNSLPTDPAPIKFTAAGLSDAWPKTSDGEPGLTCCQVPPDSIVNPVSKLYQRIDYVFSRGLTAEETHLVGDTPSSRTPSGLWPSDHAGLVATLERGESQQDK
jgi:endonuclease/exonuclease/phosphatase family metal-dependent hydrolase